jgi:hypothetical protein
MSSPCRGGVAGELGGDGKALGLEVAGKFVGRLERPAQRRHRVPARLGEGELVEGFEQTGCLSIVGFSPAPGARTRSEGSIQARTSRTARRNVFELIFDASTTKA